MTTASQDEAICAALAFFAGVTIAAAAQTPLIGPAVIFSIGSIRYAISAAIKESRGGGGQ